jgi:cob(I)alamin adenosyltransferase
MRRGFIHLYTGDGKGKTTAALGLITRAHGRGMRAVLVQFLKGRDTGEINTLKLLPNVTVIRQAQDLGFYKFANEQDKAEIYRQNNACLAEAYRLATEGLCELLVLDEVCPAYSNGSLDTELTDKLILNKPYSLELVLTGRNAPARFFDTSDYVTEFVMRKHPYNIGIAGREGVEF